MSTLDEDSIQRVLDEISDLHEQDLNFISVQFTADQQVIVRYADHKRSKIVLPASVTVSADNGSKQVKVPVSRVSGPRIEPAFGTEEDPPISVEGLDGEMGGDQCRNANTNAWGTISFYVRGGIILETTGRCNMRCETKPALVSNNHVIARSDAARQGEVIWTPFRADTARLHCFVPLSCEGNADIAAAKVHDMNGITIWTIRQIGYLKGVRRPGIGESIQKFGARTGYTRGSVTGKLNIRVDGRLYRGVFSTSGGFGCPGDSGSSVVSMGNDVLGLYSWGDVVPCDRSPAGYFFTLVDPGKGTTSSEISRARIEPNPEG